MNVTHKCDRQREQQQRADILLNYIYYLLSKRGFLYGTETSGESFGTSILSVISCFQLVLFSI